MASPGPAQPRSPAKQGICGLGAVSAQPYAEIRAAVLPMTQPAFSLTACRADPTPTCPPRECFGATIMHPAPGSGTTGM
ncbi:uncharacterized protein BDZ99DRAFT_244880 [Mytilinidion resinicola]|uniref:Uncharacterized protein n=1 Tax=Mytilinidion resinicola TaxID=574789 RepID=A0A6A6YWJ8_9PEZI|nr:uncharacterized protein BDZ99DRAFT_244880 [Mytilinidion resinicola]KAF2812928.1 hypothetical protein BDZ99DRAFT_244880 [Mytilinidion resinicola]